MPTIPEELHRPSLEQVVVDLLKSIALEETALAHLLNAEAEQMLAFVRECRDAGSTRAGCELLEQAKSQSVMLLDAIVMKEWLLLRKLEHTLELSKARRRDGRRDRECDEE